MNEDIHVNSDSSDNKPSQEQVQAIKTTEFMKETIKQRPLNKRKLMRRLGVTIAMAVIFGIVACVTFLLLEPVINSRINPQKEEQPSQVVFIEETEEEETKPEDMIADEAQLQPVVIEQAPLDDEQIEQVLNEMELGINDYIALSSSVTDLAKVVSSSVVNVIGISEDKDWINNEYENEDIVSGVIVADNGIEYLILADLGSKFSVDSYKVQFCDQNRYEATVKMQDKNSGLAIIAVRKANVKYATTEAISIVEMGTTVNRSLNGTPVIAVGRPLGTEDSLCIGHITGYQGEYVLPDATYQSIITDITGSVNASGIVVNMKGQLIGIIDMSQNSEELSNMISFYGISGIKQLIERLSNGYEIPYFGMYGDDITEETASELGLPLGVYITSLEMDSPALNVGIKGGDIIVKFNNTNVSTFQDIYKILVTLEPEQEVDVEVKRQGLDGFTTFDYTVTLGHKQ